MNGTDTQVAVDYSSINDDNEGKPVVSTVTRIHRFWFSLISIGLKVLVHPNIDLNQISKQLICLLLNEFNHRIRIFKSV